MDSSWNKTLRSLVAQIEPWIRRLTVISVEFTTSAPVLPTRRKLALISRATTTQHYAEVGRIATSLSITVQVNMNGIVPNRYAGMVTTQWSLNAFYLVRNDCRARQRALIVEHLEFVPRQWQHVTLLDCLAMVVVGLDTNVFAMFFYWSFSPSWWLVSSYDGWRRRSGDRITCVL